METLERPREACREAPGHPPETPEKRKMHEAHGSIMIHESNKQPMRSGTADVERSLVCPRPSDLLGRDKRSDKVKKRKAKSEKAPALAASRQPPVASGLTGTSVVVVDSDIYISLTSNFN